MEHLLARKIFCIRTDKFQEDVDFLEMFNI